MYFVLLLLALAADVAAVANQASLCILKGQI